MPVERLSGLPLRRREPRGAPLDALLLRLRERRARLERLLRRGRGSAKALAIGQFALIVAVLIPWIFMAFMCVGAGACAWARCNR